MSEPAQLLTKKTESGLSRVAGRYGTLGVLLVILVFFAWRTNGRFAQMSNVLNVFEQSAILSVVSFGMAVTLIGGGIDMSVAGVAGLCATVFAGLHRAGQPIWLDALGALLVGMVFGMLNGFIIVRVKVKPFVATLCTMFLAVGIKKVYNTGRPIWTTSPLFDYIARGRVLGVPLPVIMLLAITAVLYVLMDQTPFGMHLYARGGNAEGARASGVKVDRVALLSYLLAGILAAVTGIMLASRLSGTPVEVADKLIVDIFTATLIGNTLFADGAPNIAGTLVGALFVGVIQNGATLMGLGDLYVDAVKGILMLVAGAIGFSRQRKRGEFVQLTF